MSQSSTRTGGWDEPLKTLGREEEGEEVEEKEEGGGGRGGEGGGRGGGALLYIIIESVDFISRDERDAP